MFGLGGSRDLIGMAEMIATWGQNCRSNHWEQPKYDVESVDLI